MDFRLKIALREIEQALLSTIGVFPGQAQNTEGAQKFLFDKKMFENTLEPAPLSTLCDPPDTEGAQRYLFA